jgi:hypothetical protein
MVCYLELYHDWSIKKREDEKDQGDEKPRKYTHLPAPRYSSLEENYKRECENPRGREGPRRREAEKDRVTRSRESTHTSPLRGTPL